MNTKALLKVVETRLKMSKDNPTERQILNEIRLKLLKLEAIEANEDEYPDEIEE